MSTKVKTCLAILFFVYIPLWSADLTLRDGFIDTDKNRVTIQATFTVVKSHDHAKPAKEDGDIHAVGTSPKIGLTTVAEIMNAKDFQDGIDAFVDELTRIS